MKKSTRILGYFAYAIFIFPYSNSANARTQLGDVVLSAKAGDECDMRKDVLLVEDSASEHAYLQCRPAGRGVVGFWQWMPCAKGEKFYFSEQRCLTTPPTHHTGRMSTSSNSQNTKNMAGKTTGKTIPHIAESPPSMSSQTTSVNYATTIASTIVSSSGSSILGAFVNQSCANGDECLGGSVCDPAWLLCVCPPGTIISKNGGMTCDLDIPSTMSTTSVPISTRVQTISPGGSCKSNMDQCGGGSFCNSDNSVCTCPEGYVDKAGTCTMVKIESASPGEKCNSFIYCTGGATCTKGVCVCEAPLVQIANQCAIQTSPNPSKKHSGPGEPCDQGQSCTGGSLCSTVTLLCACPIGTRDNGERCAEVAEMPANLASVGQKCSVNSDCVVGAFCSASTTAPTCQCLSTHVEVGKSCYRIVFPSQRGCDLNEQCSAGFEGSVCINSICMCPAGYSARGQTCRPDEILQSITVGPGQSCASNSTINFTCTAGSSCIRGVCTCPRGRTPSGDTCVRKDGRNVHKNTTRTTTPISTENSGGSAVILSSPGSGCSSGQQCTGGSVCRNGWCVCPDSDMIVHNGTCAFGQAKTVPSPPSPETTKSASQKSTSESRNPPRPTVATVQKPSPPHPVLGHNEFNGFYLQPGMGSPIAPAPIQPLGNGHFLIPGAPGLYLPPGTGQAFPPVFIPEPTNSPIFPDQIRQPNLNEHKSNSYQPFPVLPGLLPAGISPERGTVINAKPKSTNYADKPPRVPMAAPLVAVNRPNVVLATPGSSCDDHIQCTGGSNCLRGECACNEGYEINGELCVQQSMTMANVGPLESCANGELCDGGSLCDGRTCQCPGGTEARLGLCQAVPPKLSQPNGPCSNGEHCLGESSCNRASGRCECPTATVAVGPHCLPLGRLMTNQPMAQKVKEMDDDQTIVERENHIQYVQPQTQHQAPIAMPQIMPQKSWNNNGMTITGVSRAPAPIHAGPPPVKLVQFAGLSGPEGKCDAGQACAGGSICQNGICKCPDRTAPDSNGVCQPIYSNIPAAVGEFCTENTICSGHSICINGRCRCPTWTMQSGPNCVPLAGSLLPLGTVCSWHDVCINHATCRNGICACQDGYKESNGSCQPSSPRLFPKPIEQQMFSAPGDPCVTIEDCTGGSYCRLGFCVCPLGTESVNFQCITISNTGFANAGQTCAKGERCTGRANCIDGTCQCPNDLVNINGVCQSPIQSNMVGRNGPSVIPNFGPASSQSIPNEPPIWLTNPNHIANPNLPNPTGESGADKNDLHDPNPLTMTGLPLDTRIPLNSIIPNLPPNNYSIPLSSLIHQGGNKFTLPLASVLSQQQSQNNLDLRQIMEYLKNYQTGQPVHVTLNKNNLIPGHGQNGQELTNGFPQQNIPNVGSQIPQPVSNMMPIIVGHSEAQQQSQIRNKFNPLPPALPGQDCVVGQLCTGGAVCSMGICACPAGLKVGNDNQCVPDGQFVPPGSFCSNDQTCLGGSYCITGVCLCPPGQEIFGNQCQDLLSKTAKPNEPCEKGVRCMGGSVCYHDGHCRCLPPSKLNADACRIPEHASRPPNNASRVSASRRSNSCPLPENSTACTLPDCFCSKTGKTAAGNLKLDETPQFIVLTMDDAVNEKNLEPYSSLFDGRYGNKNGCPLRATFFVSHESTDYSDVQQLYLEGHEIASNSITHQDIGNEKVDRWISDIEGQRRIISKLANIDPKDIVGFRAAQLSLSRDASFLMMQKTNFLYDNSMSANPGVDQAPYWPQTLDYNLPWECQNSQCPHHSYAGLWSMPLNQFFNGPSLSADTPAKNSEAYIRGAMIRATLGDEETEESVYKMLNQNFMRTYRTNKAPYILTLDAILATVIPENGTMKALEKFLNEVSQKPDVWFVTMRQLLDWMRSPLSVQKLNDFPAFSCDQWNERQQKNPMCENPTKCMYRTKRLSRARHSFKTCSPCPTFYPWIDNVHEL